MLEVTETMCGTLEYDASDIKGLTERALSFFSDKRVIILLAGVPGSGKSRLSSKVVKELTEAHHIKSMVLPQDGYHLYRSELAQLPNPEEAFIRRGAPFTFNAIAFSKTVHALKDPNQVNETIKSPSFDHRLKDPLEDDIVIEQDTKIVFVEGNYVLLKDKGWRELAEIADDTWFVTARHPIVRERIVKRHLEAGIASSEEEAIERADGSDLKNAQYIEANSMTPHILIHNN